MTDGRHDEPPRRADAPVRAAFMVTCLGDMFYPEVGVRIVKLLRSLGVEVQFPEAQTCCGLPLFNSGYHPEAAEIARRTIEVFGDAEHVVVPSGSCAWMVKHEYPGLMKEATTDENASVPFLGDIPLLGNLFKQRRIVRVKRELVILLKPTIINAAADWAGEIKDADDRVKKLRIGS